jgi:hypothetical protein
MARALLVSKRGPRLNSRLVGCCCENTVELVADQAAFCSSVTV